MKSFGFVCLLTGLGGGVLLILCALVRNFYPERISLDALRIGVLLAIGMMAGGFLGYAFYREFGANDR